MHRPGVDKISSAVFAHSSFEHALWQAALSETKFLFSEGLGRILSVGQPLSPVPSLAGQFAL
jgi:hypothetical protein